jgi:hypothetical protein
LRLTRLFIHDILRPCVSHGWPALVLLSGQTGARKPRQSTGRLWPQHGRWPLPTAINKTSGHRRRHWRRKKALLLLSMVVLSMVVMMIVVVGLMLVHVA